MNLVIKNQRDTAPSGAEKLYRDALVSEGTLMLVDFSNKGTTFEYDLSRGVYDLGRDAAELLGVYTAPSVDIVGDVQLTNDRGFPPLDVGAESAGDYTKGIIMHGINQYLYDNQPPSVFVFWVKADMNYGNLATSVIIKSEDSSAQGNLYVQNPSTVNPYVSVRMANKVSLGNYNIGSQYTQIAVEFIGPSTANKAYVNGAYYQDGSDTEGGFIEPTGNGFVSLGHRGVAGTNGSLILYRAFVEDLSVSGRSASDVVMEDYNYVNALGDYAGIEKRPFANV